MKSAHTRYSPQRRAACLLVLAACVGTAAAQTPALASARATLVLADQPLRLIRGAALYKAGKGVAVQNGDILETGAAGAHLEFGTGPDVIVALGPQTRVLFVNLGIDGRAGMEVALLGGWIKLLAAGSRRTLVVTPALQVTLAGGATIVRGQGDRAAVFAEEGQQQAMLAGARSGVLTLAPEQYAEADPAKPQLVTGRPPRDFLRALPPGFRDRLVRAPAVANAGKVAPLKERDVDFTDIEAWLTAPLPARRSLVARFKPRLADPAFRTALQRSLGQSDDWKPVLQPARPAVHTQLF